MKCIYLFLFIFLCSNLFAQSSKVYVRADGSFSNKPDSALCYLLITKSNDSTYLVDQYDLNNNILVQGTYKDENLSIKEGKFHYYNYNSKSETIGYYLNGKRNGLWSAYDAEGKLADWTYENGILNGPFKNYNNVLIFPYWEEGNVVNGMLEGKFSIFNQDSTLIYQADYKHNKQLNQRFPLAPPNTNRNLIKYLQMNLKPYAAELRNDGPILKISIDDNGKILRAKILKGIKPEIDSLFITSLKTSPNFTPAKFNNTPIKITFNIMLSIYGESYTDDYIIVAPNRFINIGDGALSIINN